MFFFECFQVFRHIAVGGHVAGLHALSGQGQPGIDFMNIHFGRKLFGYFFILKFWAKLHPKTTDVDLSEYNGLDFKAF
jgi:hypothetical protein